MKAGNDEGRVTKWQRIKNYFYWKYLKARVRLPWLVWMGDRVEIGIHLPYNEETWPKIKEIERLFRELGISFDTGAGCGRRDWEWDASLHGPIHITYSGRLPG